MSDTNLGSMFWTAAQGTPAATVEAPKTSSCCGPKPAAATPERTGATEATETKGAPVVTDATPEAARAEAPKKSSCCGPKPAADTAEKAAAPKTSSCCGPKPAATAEATPVAAAAAPAKKSSCCG